MKNKTKILIIDDEAITAKAIEKELNNMGYSFITIAINCHQAIRNIKNNLPNLILLDINLKSNFNGMDIANHQMVLNKIPIIYLTGYINQHTLKNILAIHPQVFLSKPINFDELKVNISLILNNGKETINIGSSFNYDFNNKNLFYKEEYIKLSINEKTLLEALIKEKGNVIPFDTLVFQIWGNEVKSDSSLRTLVGNLRKKLKPNMIVNVVGFGYKLI